MRPRSEMLPPRRSGSGAKGCWHGPVVSTHLLVSGVAWLRVYLNLAEGHSRAADFAQAEKSDLEGRYWAQSWTSSASMATA